jgi:ATP phosphoribosyltransferase
MRLPDATGEYSQQQEQQKNLLLEQADTLNVKKFQDIEIGDAKLVLKSPNGSRFSVTVDNSGNLAATSI